MKKLIIVILLIITASVINSQELVPYNKFSEYREVGDTRLWTFVKKDSTIGSLTSIVADSSIEDGKVIYKITELMKLDYNKVGNPLKMNIASDHFISADGEYFGDKMKIEINDQKERLEMERKGGMLEGFITRGGDEYDQKVELSADMMTYEYNYFDQLEHWLATQNIKVNEQIEDTIYMPQSMSKSFMRARVMDFRNIRLYNEVFDSCFEIVFNMPADMTCYFNKKKQLKKIILPLEDLKVYLDHVGNSQKMKAAMEKLKEQKQAARPTLPVASRVQLYFIYLVMGLFGALFYITGQFKNVNNYLGLVLGGVIFVVIPFTQISFVDSFFKNVYLPNVMDNGGSPFVWGIIPALVSGLIQELLKIIVLILAIKLITYKKESYIALGALIGAGFGIVESCYLANGFFASQLFGANLIERAFFIIMHASTGALLGFGLQRGYAKMFSVGIVAILVNSLLRYFPIFVQSIGADPNLLTILFAFVVIFFLLGLMILFRKKQII